MYQLILSAVTDSEKYDIIGFDPGFLLT